MTTQLCPCISCPENHTTPLLLLLFWLPAPTLWISNVNLPFGRFECEPEGREPVSAHDVGVGAVAEEDVDERRVARLYRHVQRGPVGILQVQGRTKWTFPGWVSIG